MTSSVSTVPVKRGYRISCAQRQMHICVIEYFTYFQKWISEHAYFFCCVSKIDYCALLNWRYSIAFHLPVVAVCGFCCQCDF